MKHSSSINKQKIENKWIKPSLLLCDCSQARNSRLRESVSFGLLQSTRLNLNSFIRSLVTRHLSLVTRHLFTPLLFLLPALTVVYDAKADTAYTLDGGNDKMVFQLKSNGVYNLYKKNASGGIVKQIYSTNAVLFSLKIGTSIYKSGECGGACGGQSISGIGTVLTASDVSAATTGTVMHIEKKYSGKYNNYPFEVRWRVDYNKAEDRLAFTATIDVSKIPAGTMISYSYAVDTYVNADDNAKAITIPDIVRNGMSLNNSGGTYTLTQAELETVNFIGCINTTANGNDMFGFYADGGRKFDRAYSAYYGPVASPQKYLKGNYNGQVLLNTNNVANTFNYSTTDNGIGVAYDSIPTGEITVINTSAFIASNVTSNANLDWTWNDRKILNAAAGTAVSLKINASNLGTAQITGIGYTVAMPSGLPASGAVTHTGFTGGTYTGSAGSTSCSVSGANIPINTTGQLVIPVSTAKYGSWTMAASQFSGLIYTVNPAGIAPAVLNLRSVVNYTSADTVSVVREQSTGYTIKLPAGVKANGALTVNLSNTNTTDFTAPSSVVIPDGGDSIRFNVTAKATAAPGAANTTTIGSLSGSNSSYVSVGATKTVVTSAKVPVLTQPSVSPACPGDTVTVNFTGSDIVASQCTWTNTNTAIGLGAGGSGNISFTAANATSGAISGTVTVIPHDKGDSIRFTITVNPRLAPAVDITAQPNFIICEGDTTAIVFTALPTNGGAAPSYVWNLNGSAVGGITNSYKLTNLNQHQGKSKISCMLTSSIACPSTTTVSSEKEIWISSCVIPVNQHIRGRIK
ncbi:MAG: hypothetical protein LBP83_00420 [Dysgonamonadaceae bacterium]|nr:hypothetical protein [Dysgonamonadaceae bacterium]